MQSMELLLKKAPFKVNMVHTALTSCQEMFQKSKCMQQTIMFKIWSQLWKLWLALIHQINHIHPVHRIEIYPVDNVIILMNNWTLSNTCHDNFCKLLLESYKSLMFLWKFARNCDSLYTCISKQLKTVHVNLLEVSLIKLNYVSSLTEQFLHTV